METKNCFRPPRLYFYTTLTLKPSQIVILVQSALLNIESNFFHKFICIIEFCPVQFYDNPGHVGRTKYDFPSPRLYFYTIFTIVTLQMAILLKRAILKNGPNIFHN